MRLTSVVFCSFLLAFSMVLASCSSTSNTSKTVGDDAKATNSSESSSIYPEWYNGSKTFTSSPSVFNSFGSSVASDSLGALKKATDRAISNLESGVSAKLESIRSEAAIELGSDSGLDSPRFILVLRKAEREISDIFEAENTIVQKNPSTQGYRSFVQIQVGKSSLITELDKRFSGYAKAWNAMKGSEAFSEF